MSQPKLRAYSPFLSIFVLSRSSEDWMMPTHIGEGSCSLLSLLMDSNSNLFQRHLHRNNVLPAIWASFSPVKLTHTINYYNSCTNITRDQNYGKLGSKLRHTLVFFNWCSSQLGKRVPQFFDNVQWMAGRQHPWSLLTKCQCHLATHTPTVTTQAPAVHEALWRTILSLQHLLRDSVQIMVH